MSPVSRNRKKKAKKPGKRVFPKGALEALVPPRPNWFSAATATALAGSDALVAARGPLELEEATSLLLGERLVERTRVEGATGLRFTAWAREVADRAAEQVLAHSEDLSTGAWKGPWRLLHGMLSIGAPELASAAESAIERCAGELGAAGGVPSWLAVLGGVAPTGELWSLRDAHGTRGAVIAGYAYPDGVDRSVFLFDYDVTDFAVELPAPGAFPDVAAAEAAWRTSTGEQTVPLVEGVSPEVLAIVLAGGTVLLDSVIGVETDQALRNWYRAQRRAQDLIALVRDRGVHLPAPLPVEQQAARMAEEFTTWHHTRHGATPDDETVETLALDWVEKTAEGTHALVSPRRVECVRESIQADRDAGVPTMLAELSLLPEWAGWLAERAGLAEELVREVRIA
ncbi:hypothetical protein [Actinosynnema mirum]|uniref:Uncharacterized protein n=1 Tax=Actinosynnema mirum (strain ATCC 29888 / DSM 43827 / JCM 3225 / NBRC 14064 / NCIMB 13271 / NRRL B-12336 / IMRU 3971 / 101) TaxID=446462 RepID=C6WNK4_ACTMD|nr:hypothetical protein [Actinosynnema mirum]ACU34923.1 hypothetical protein Amir_0965 [Actinosynnema mirum DSM 43827]